VFKVQGSRFNDLESRFNVQTLRVEPALGALNFEAALLQDEIAFPPWPDLAFCRLSDYES
jgi:hypothetical protein